MMMKKGSFYFIMYSRVRLGHVAISSGQRSSYFTTIIRHVAKAPRSPNTGLYSPI